jgi:hypothetical protein
MKTPSHSVGAVETVFSLNLNSAHIETLGTFATPTGSGANSRGNNETILFYHSYAR